MNQSLRGRSRAGENWGESWGENWGENWGWAAALERRRAGAALVVWRLKSPRMIFWPKPPLSFNISNNFLTIMILR
jgi:hypothetical protein